MGTSTKVIDPDEHTIVIAGIPIDEGFGENSMIKIVPRGPNFLVKEGVDGQVSRSKSKKGRNLDVEITLMQTSAANQRLSALANLDMNQSGGAGIGAFLLQDRQGLTKVASDSCFIVQEPDIEIGAEATERVWKILVVQAVRFDGGN